MVLDLDPGELQYKKQRGTVRYSDLTAPVPSSQTMDIRRCSVCNNEKPESGANCVMCGADSNDLSAREAEPGESVKDNVPAVKATGLLASLPETADSVSERLLTLAQTDEEAQEFTDDVGESSRTAFTVNRFPGALSSGLIIFADENSCSPLAAPDDSSIQGIFRGASGLTKSEEKEQLDPQSPPRVDRMGFEALSPLPQRLPPKVSMEQPWEMPPDLTATQSPKYHSPKTSGDNNADDEVSPRQRLTRLVVCCVVVLALFLSLWFMPERDSGDDSGSPGIRVTISPTIAPTTSGMTQPTQQPSSVSLSGTPSPTTAIATPLSPTIAPTTFEMVQPTQIPSLSPIFGTPSPTTTAALTSSPTFAPTISGTTTPMQQTSSSPTLSTLSPTTNVNPPTTNTFTSQTSFQGATDGTRLGLGVVMDESGVFFASLDGRGNVQLYQNSNTGSGWTLLSTFTSATELVEGMDMVVVNGIPLIAMASPDSIQVLEYRNDGWDSVGDIALSSGQSGGAAPIVALSSNGTILATASLENGGNNWNVEVWEWNRSWVPKGAAVIHNDTTSSPVLSLSLDLSGDGEVFVIGDWTIDRLAVTIHVYRWDGQGWSSLGSSPSLLWGPVDVNLRNDGKGFAVATPPPSSARVYEWSETSQDWEALGNDLLGGTAVALSDNGRRVVIGSPLTSTVTIYDQSSNGSWEMTDVLNSTIGDQFGSSISMGRDGNILVVGSPLDDQGGSNAGLVSVYA